MMLAFDVGESLASEERCLGSRADWLGVPRGTFFAASAPSSRRAILTRVSSACSGPASTSIKSARRAARRD
jgi:hypothetical protein